MHSACIKGLRTILDQLTRERRSYCMFQVRGKDTGLEMRVRSELHNLDLGRMELQK
ncbi:MAG: hypothetical protein OXG15_09840 [Gammaproteobacteria bacterium]|nr:hypothetical protein [Gammaproteobacteria bacterium]